MSPFKTRAQVIEALQAHAKGQGPAIVWRAPAPYAKNCACQYHKDDGCQVLTDTGWRNDMIAHPVEYHITTEKRTFLGLWREVETFDDAEPAGSFRGIPCATACIGGERLGGIERDAQILNDGRTYFVTRLENTKTSTT